MFNPFSWFLDKFVRTSKQIDTFIDSVPCKFGKHDYQLVLPENFNIYYEHIPCECGLIFRGLADIQRHLWFGAPKCKFDRVCLKCGHVDLRLNEALNKAVEALYIETGPDRETQAYNIYKEKKKKELHLPLVPGVDYHVTDFTKELDEYRKILYGSSYNSGSPKT